MPGKYVLLTICLFLQGLHLNILSQEDQHKYFFPLDIPLAISSSFGELRVNAFHTGVDFKTMGTSGLNVYAIDDGYVVRMKVEPGGYGKALYINHPDGYTSVYAHIEEMRADMEQYCKEEQYKKKQFGVDIMLPPGRLTVKKGDVIAQSGNRGASSGPHLHFEIRETQTEFSVNFFRVSNITIPDTVAPVIEKVRIYPMNENSRINNKKEPVNFAVTSTGNECHINGIIEASGKIGIGLQVYDRTNNSLNKTGVYSVELMVNDSLVFRQECEKLSFNEVRYVNSLMDYGLLMRDGVRVNRLFLQPNNKLSIYPEVVNRGVISCNDSGKKHILIRVEDVYGNYRVCNFVIKSKKSLFQGTLSSKASRVKTKLSWKTDNTFFDKQSVKVYFPKDALYDDLLFEYSKYPAMSGYYSMIYQFHNSYTPLHRAATVSVKPVNLPANLQKKALLIGVNSAGNIIWAGGGYKEGYVVADIKSFGRYIVGIDTTAPTITPLFTNIRNNDFTKWSRISFEVKDNLSGIKSFYGTVDGQWVLFEYDPKFQLLFYKFDPERMKFGCEHTLDLVVVDEKGNKTTYHTLFTK